MSIQEKFFASVLLIASSAGLRLSLKLDPAGGTSLFAQKRL